MSENEYNDLFYPGEWYEPYRSKYLELFDREEDIETDLITGRISEEQAKEKINKIRVQESKVIVKYINHYIKTHASI